MVNIAIICFLLSITGLINKTRECEFGIIVYMARISKKLGEQFKKEAKNKLLQEIKGISSVSDVENFLNKFFTPNEKDLILRRIVIEDFLNSNKKYREIKKILEVSSNTISNVRDIIEKRGYGNNPNRKIKYSPLKKSSGHKEYEPIFPKYKGAKSII